MKIILIVSVLFALNCQADIVTASPTAGPAATISTTPAPSPTAPPKKKPAQKKKP